MVAVRQVYTHMYISLTWIFAMMRANIRSIQVMYWENSMHASMQAYMHAYIHRGIYVQTEIHRLDRHFGDLLCGHGRQKGGRILTILRLKP